MKDSKGQDKCKIIAAVCNALATSGAEVAAAILHRDYRFDPQPIVKRKYGPTESTRIFARDGFVDPYTGTRVVFPPVFRALSFALPADFPFHPAWKTDVTHPAYWELGATIDHLVPVTRGGLDNETNWITASMASNSAKMNWTVEELGWHLHPGELARMGWSRRVVPGVLGSTFRDSNGEHSSVAEGSTVSLGCDLTIVEPDERSSDCSLRSLLFDSLAG
jgi:hypothetical protein